MDAWGWTYGSAVNDTVELIVAELAANAVTHGRVPGRDAELRLLTLPDPGLVRIEVSDARGECLPRLTDGAPDEDSGRGLLLVAALAGAWGVAERAGGPGKTVWAVVAVRAGALPPPGSRSPAPSPATSGHMLLTTLTVPERAPAGPPGRTDAHTA
ncbi:ATP-binding protein [Streptomyces sp. ISL-12]|uniref:ATP-binding protein n=1 Tax=Streptomyces sp. ISL-12 TaxID=2819177 RepID=UPI0027E03BE3|nr:ATP-binding protein [Streptomyces sp. ISL-12]